MIFDRTILKGKQLGVSPLVSGLLAGLITTVILLSVLWFFSQFLNALFVPRPLFKPKSIPVFQVEEFKNKEPLVVPFTMDGSGRPYVDVEIDGHKLNALFDTGSGATLIRHTAVPNGKDGSVEDFHGGREKVQELNLKVCLGDECEYEEVDVTPTLSEKAILQGSFLLRFKTATWDFRAHTITLVRR
jgi:hypothetical protein